MYRNAKNGWTTILLVIRKEVAWNPFITNLENDLKA